MADRHGSKRTAPFYEVPARRIVSVEHPGIIRNVDRAINTLQGTDGIFKVKVEPCLLLRQISDWFFRDRF
jgi:general transcription factor 3C polypeptide 5 (transcription factor C subunit 1)